MLNKNNYKDIIIIDKDGIILYADIGNPQCFKVGMNSIKGKRIKELFLGMDNSYPLLKAVNEGTAYDDFEVTVTTSRNIKMSKKGCAYPLFYNDEPIAAVEFADFFYDKNHIGEIEVHADHPIYRGNNTKYLLDDIITGDESMVNLKKRIEKYAVSDSTVLIYGETGTGKELVAQALHNKSKRYYRKFISQNCSAIPDNLLESILFGTTKGSFTGAKDNPGLFELAEGGTLFLDEINSLNINLQVKILKAIEEKRIRRIGSTSEIDIDVRIIAATNEKPELLIKEKRFKPDLFYRLAVIYIKLPSLIDRGDDIYVLSNHFINYFNIKMNCSIKELSPEIMKIFMEYSWPGNVRELRNVIEGVFALSEDNTINIRDIPAYILDSVKNKKIVKPLRLIKNEGLSLTDKINAVEKNLIEQAYEESRCSLKKSSEMLGISKQLMNYKLKRYGIKNEN